MGNPVVAFRLEDAAFADLDHEARQAGVQRTDFARLAVLQAIANSAAERAMRRHVPAMPFASCVSASRSHGAIDTASEKGGA